MIIMSIAGVGKTSLRKDPNAIKSNILDLDSSHFKHYPFERDPYWYITYSNQAIDLSNQGYTVLISSHNDVRKYLQDINYPYYAIYPIKSLKNDWLKRLQFRYYESHLASDLRSYNKFSENWDTIMDDIWNDNFVSVITPIEDMNYILIDKILQLKSALLKG